MVIHSSGRDRHAAGCQYGDQEGSIEDVYRGEFETDERELSAVYDVW